jgi:hypothetical protein
MSDIGDSLAKRSLNLWKPDSLAEWEGFEPSVTGNPERFQNESGGVLFRLLHNNRQLTDCIILLQSRHATSSSMAEGNRYEPRKNSEKLQEKYVLSVVWWRHSDQFSASESNTCVLSLIFFIPRRSAVSWAVASSWRARSRSPVRADFRSIRAYSY